LELPSSTPSHVLHQLQKKKWRVEGILIIYTSKYVYIPIVATYGNNNLTTWLASIETELERESPIGHKFQQWNGI